MPTENRSSNTEMVSVPRELVRRLVSATVAARGEGSPTQREAEALLSQPAPQHPEPIAWMVGTAIWWTKEEAERDAAATGLPTVGLGPMTGIAPAEQHQGEPAAWRGLNELGEVVTEWIDGSPPSSMVDLSGNPASFARIEQAYTHADPGEVERCEARLHEVASLCASVEQERDTLRTQFAERDALLAETRTLLHSVTALGGAKIGTLYSHTLHMGHRIAAALSASAEPSAPTAVIPDGYCVMPRQLTADNGAKALLLGEFKLEVTRECPECLELEEPAEGCEICDGEGEYGQRHTIPWDMIKHIYSTAVKGLALQPSVTSKPS